MSTFKRTKLEVYQPQSIILPKEAPVHRIFPFKGLNRLNQVDWVDDSIFYDVFYKHDNSSIICIGPPLLNLEGALELQEISCNGRQLRYSLRKLFKDYILVVIKVPRFLRSELTVQLSFRFNLFEKVVEISRNHPPAGENGKSLLTLVTVQKDNPLQWIKDWLHWHNRMHGVGRLILYDNGSREYGHDELVNTLQGEEEDFQSVLVNWDFPYTWDGWDGRKASWSAWPQVTALNHCYLKYGDCGWLLNLDIDEYLVAAEDTTPLRDYLRQTTRHYLPFRERRFWQLGHSSKSQAELSFRDFLYRTPTSQHYFKYACQCNRPLWLGVHLVFRQGIGRYRFRLQTRFFRLIKAMGLIKLFGMNNNNDLPGEMFLVYHFMSLNIMWRPGDKNGKGRAAYRDKAYFEAQGIEITYDDTMIKQAQKHGL